MSVVGSFVKRNRYSTEASEWGKEEASLLNLIYSKRVCVYTCVYVSLSAYMFLPYSWSPSHPAQLSPVRAAMLVMLYVTCIMQCSKHDHTNVYSRINILN